MTAQITKSSYPETPAIAPSATLDATTIDKRLDGIGESRIRRLM